MERTWMKVGAQYTKTESQRGRVLAVVDRLEWQELPCTLGALPGGTIEATIQQLRLPKVSKVAVGTYMGRYGLYGIEANFSNGRARVYVLDRGTGALPLFSDFYPAEAVVDAEVRVTA